MSLSNYKDPHIELLVTADAANQFALQKRDASREQRAFNKTSQTVAKIVASIAESGDLPLMLAAELNLQMIDQNSYTRDHAAMDSVKDGIRQFEGALSFYDQLVNRPDEYRSTEAGYHGGHRDRAKDIPIDGMRRAINSQMTRLNNRRALTPTNEENELLKARRALLNSIRKDYSLLQERVLHHRRNGKKDKGTAP